MTSSIFGVAGWLLVHVVARAARGEPRAWKAW
jgi:hypothetical protein